MVWIFVEFLVCKLKKKCNSGGKCGYIFSGGEEVCPKLLKKKRLELVSMEWCGILIFGETDIDKYTPRETTYVPPKEIMFILK